MYVKSVTKDKSVALFEPLLNKNNHIVIVDCYLFSLCGGFA